MGFAAKSDFSKICCRLVLRALKAGLCFTLYAHIATESIIVQLTRFIIVITTSKLWIPDGFAKRINVCYIGGTGFMTPVSVIVLSPEMVVGACINGHCNLTCIGRAFCFKCRGFY